MLCYLQARFAAAFLPSANGSYPQDGSEDFYLTHAGKCLSDPSATLGDYGVEAGSVVQALCRLNGGGQAGQPCRGEHPVPLPSPP